MPSNVKPDAALWPPPPKCRATAPDVEAGLGAQVHAHLVADLPKQHRDVDAAEHAHGVGKDLGLLGKHAELGEVLVGDPRVGDVAVVGEREARQRPASMASDAAVRFW